MKHSPRPKAVSASRVADSKSSSTSSSVQATLRPRPPPPKAALMAIGRPLTSANARASRALATGPGVPATSGAPTDSRDAARLDLVAERLDHLGIGPDPDEAGRLHRTGEVGPLGEEAVARMHRLGAGAAGDVR